MISHIVSASNSPLGDFFASVPPVIIGAFSFASTLISPIASPSIPPFAINPSASVPLGASASVPHVASMFPCVATESVSYVADSTWGITAATSAPVPGRVKPVAGTSWIEQS